MDALFERGIELPDFVGGMLALRDVGDRADVVEHFSGAFIAHRNAVRQTPPRSAVAAEVFDLLVPKAAMARHQFQ